MNEGIAIIPIDMTNIAAINPAVVDAVITDFLRNAFISFVLSCSFNDITATNGIC
jgi:hypothetical protein